MTERARVRRVEDDWVEVPATLASDAGVPTEPIELRPGTDDGDVQISNVPRVGAQVRADELRQGLDLIEREAA